MKTKFALINKFNALPNHLGSVESFHRSQEAAEKADRALQLAVRRHNGSSSYLPTGIVEVDARMKKLNSVHESWAV